jgi:hypothetical protein
MNIVSASYNVFGAIDVVYENMPPNTTVTVPIDPANKDYVEVLAWEADGNTITPYSATAPVAVIDERQNYDAMLERRAAAAAAKGDTEAAVQILLQLHG